ncbi:MAG: hypothetical protein IK147_04990 [Clostridia bacterium]|nr:hypothetical protein [Clostridia bacterium]
MKSGGTKTSAKLKKEIIKRISVMLISGVLLIFFSGYSFGWFSSNKSVSGAGMGVGVRRESIDVEFEYFMYDIKNETYVSASDISAIEFNQYDLVFRSRNNYTPVVIRLAIKKIELPESGTLIASIYRDEDVPETTTSNAGMQMSAYSSSVMRFTPFINSSYYGATAAAQFTNVHDPNFNTVRGYYTGDQIDQNGSQVFTTVSYTDKTINSVTKESVVSLEFPYNQGDFDGDTVYAYVYVTYDEGLDDGSYKGLMGIYLDTAGLTSINTDIVQFDNDFVSIGVTLSTEQGG